MNRANLLPADRRAANRHRRARRRWVLIDTALAVVLLVIAVLFIGGRTAPEAVAAGRPSDLSTLNAKLIATRQQSAALQVKARIAAEGSDRPDFSRLLTAMARSLGGDIVLDTVIAAPAANGTTRSVTLGGVGRSHAAVTQFVLRIEAMRLFNGVRLSETSMRAAGGIDGVGFRIQCALPAGDS